jgi:hypothetical protein
MSYLVIAIGSTIITLAIWDKVADLTTNIGSHSYTEQWAEAFKPNFKHCLLRKDYE